MFLFYLFQRQQISKYENWACAVLTRCQDNPEDNTEPSDLLIRVLPNWGNVTCLNLAESAENLTFLSHPVIEKLLKDKWQGQIQGNECRIRKGLFSQLVELFRVRTTLLGVLRFVVNRLHFLHFGMAYFVYS